jgi:hypothetical protein
MLAYTITNGGTYSTDAYEYKYTTSITDTFTLETQVDCDNTEEKTFTQTYYTASTLQLFHNGHELTSIFKSYKNNAPRTYKYFFYDSNFNCQGIGGYYRTTSFTLKGFTIQEPDGKRTEYTEVSDVNDKKPPRTFPQATIIKWTTPWDDTTNVPVITTRTVNKNVYNTSTTKASFESSFIKAGDSLSLVNFETSQTTNTDRIGSKTTEWIISNKEEKTRLGYSYGGAEYTPYLEFNSLNFNYADTVVFITNNNILWYITDYGEGEFTKKFKSTRGVGQQVTIKHSTPKKLEELPIGFLPYSQLFPYTVLDPVKSTISYETASRSIIDFEEKNINTNDLNILSFPIGTYNSQAEILTNSTSKITTKSYKKYEDTQPVENTTNYKTVLQLINADTLQFHRAYKEIDTILTAKSFVAYSFGEYTEDLGNGGFTAKDEIGYTSLIQDAYSLNTEGGGEFIFNKGYLNGQAAINNLSIVEQVSFKDKQTYKNINAVGGPASLYQKVPLAFAKFAKSFTFIDNNSTKTAYSPIEDTNLKLDLRYVLISSSKESISNNGQKYTKIETTKHEFGLKGAKPNTYLNYIQNNISNGLLVDPNKYCKLNSTLFNDMNCGIFCDDGQIKSFITRIIYPGTYLAINTEGIKSSIIGKVVTLTQGIKSYYYLPWNGSIQSNGTLNLLSPSFTSASHDISNFLPEGLSSMTNI